VRVDYTIVGVQESADKFEGGYYRMYAAAATEMKAQMLGLRNYAVTTTMHGQVINQRTGNLVRNVISETEEQGTSIVGRVGVPTSNTAPYARILELGGQTRAHIIEAVNAKTLAFTMGGVTMFRRQVNHPGSKFPARPYLAIARDAMIGEIRAGLARAMEAAKP
jgi:phage gpG-like protein